eukprot:jgi/Psemu1/9922/gm1.9922_g
MPTREQVQQARVPALYFWSLLKGPPSPGFKFQNLVSKKIHSWRLKEVYTSNLLKLKWSVMARDQRRATSLQLERVWLTVIGNVTSRGAAISLATRRMNLQSATAMKYKHCAATR